MEIYIVEDDMSVISVLQDIIEDNEMGTAGKRLQGKMHHDFPGGGKRIDRQGIRCGH